MLGVATVCGDHPLSAREGDEESCGESARDRQVYGYESDLLIGITVEHCDLHSDMAVVPHEFVTYA